MSSNERAFNEAKGVYQEALPTAGYKHRLEYNPNRVQRRACRKRSISWYNPPYNSNVKTRIGSEVLRLIDKHFPPDNELSRILNRNTVKISYCLMKNFKSIISQINQKKMGVNRNQETKK